PVQQQTFATTLDEVIRDVEQPDPAVLRAEGALAALPDVDPAFLVNLGQDERPVVRDAALRALGKLDGGQGAQPLIEALGDGRARVAVYALRRALLEMLPERALDVLRVASKQQVTVAKEIVRLLGDLRSDAAYAELLALERTDLQRDVRVALLRAFWEHLDR